MNKVLKVAALGATVMTLATVASAATMELNIYGASAQGKFWNDYAETFLRDTTLGMGCDTLVVKGFQDADKKLGITVMDGCDKNGADGRVIIRYTANKSIEGPRAVAGMDPQHNDTCTPGDTFSGDYTRKMADWNGSALTTDCFKVHIGASDVATESFTQNTYNGGGNYKNGLYNTATFGENLANVSATLKPGETQLGITADQPIVVPFAFFLSNDVTNVDNLTRQQILLLMSGKVNNWNQFGKTETGFPYPNKRVVLCHRHAGSGTLATLDKAILRGDASIPNVQNVDVEDGSLAFVTFYDSSTDMMKCINENGKIAEYAAENEIELEYEFAAIGYADADAITTRIEEDGTEVNETYTNTKRVRYNGIGEGMTPANYLAFRTGAGTPTSPYKYQSPLKYQITKAQYEFWSAQWMYYVPSATDTNLNTMYTNMMKYTSEVKLPCPGRGCYWLTKDELKNIKKATDAAVPSF